MFYLLVEVSALKMSKKKCLSAEKIIDGLKNNDLSVVHECLVNIKTFSKNGKKMIHLVKLGAMKLIISYLEHPVMCIISLSIVADCCLNPYICDIVIDNDAVLPLVRIIKNFINDDIVSRACRAVGNIAITDRGLAVIHENCPVAAIINILSSTENVFSLLNALRALRILNRDSRKHSHLLVSEKAFLTVSKFFSSGDIHVKRCAIKTMAILSKAVNAAAISQIKNSEIVVSLHKLYYDTDQEISEYALICLTNLTKHEELFSKCTLEIFIYVANNYSTVDKKSKFAILALCYCSTICSMCYHVISLGGLPVLLSALQNSTYESIHKHILLALAFLCIRIKRISVFQDHKIIPILKEKMKVFVKTNSKDHSMRKSTSDDFNSAKYKIKENKIDRNDKSPKHFHMKAASTEHAAFRVTNNPCYPLFHKKTEHCNDSLKNSKFCKIKGNDTQISLLKYSPLQKEKVHTNKKRLKIDATDSSISDIGKLSGNILEYIKNWMTNSEKLVCIPDFDNICRAFCIPEDHSMSVILYHIVNLVNTHNNVKIFEDFQFSLIFDYAMLPPCPNPVAVELLHTLVSSNALFELLISQNFFINMDKILRIIHEPKLCHHCDELQKVKERLTFHGRKTAESPFCMGILQHILFSSNSHYKLQCLYATCKMVSDRKLLYKVLIEDDGLSIILSFLKSEDVSLFETSAIVLSTLSTVLLKKYSYESNLPDCTYACCQYQASTYDIEFVLDDGSKVLGVKSVLKSSEYFNSLLNGNYIESSQESVMIPCIADSAFSSIMHLLHGCRANSCCFVFKMNLKEAVEVLGACERFLLTSTKLYVEMFIMQSMKMDCAAQTYLETQLHSPDFSEIVLNYILQQGISNTENYLKCLKKLLNENEKNIIQHIKHLITTNLSVSIFR